MIYFRISAKETLFVYGGVDGTFIDSVDAISLSTSNVLCPPISSLPYKVDLITAATVDGAPILCGGWNGSVNEYLRKAQKIKSFLPESLFYWGVHMAKK